MAKNTSDNAKANAEAKAKAEAEAKANDEAKANAEELARNRAEAEAKRKAEAELESLIQSIVDSELTDSALQFEDRLSRFTIERRAEIKARVEFRKARRVIIRTRLNSVFSRYAVLCPTYKNPNVLTVKFYEFTNGVMLDLGSNSLPAQFTVLASGKVRRVNANGDESAVPNYDDIDQLARYWRIYHNLVAIGKEGKIDHRTDGKDHNYAAYLTRDKEPQYRFKK